MQKSGFENKLNALKTEYSQMGVQLQTKASERCPFAVCDGSGILHYINWTKKADAIDHPEKYRLKDIEIEWTEKCKCLKQQEIDREISAAGIPKKYATATVNEFKVDIYKSEISRESAMIAKAVAANYVRNFKQIVANEKSGLYLYSATKGSGKTRLASSIANALIKVYESSVLFLKATDVSPQVRKTYNKESKSTEEDVLKAFRDAEVLVIDDLAVADEKGFTEDLLGRILDHRMDRGAVTIITSNITIEDLKKFYPKNIVGSRIKKLCFEILMPEESIRDAEAEQDNQRLEDLLFGTNEGA